MSKTIREYIADIHVEKSNLEHIAKTGKINGSLLISIEKAMNDYSESQTQELKEQNAELVEALETIASLITSQTSISTVKTSLLQILTKYNHLNKKT